MLKDTFHRMVVVVVVVVLRSEEAYVMVNHRNVNLLRSP